MAELMHWKMLINDLGHIGLCGSAQNHPRYSDGTRITYVTKLKELEIQEGSFAFSTQTVSYLAPFSEYTGVSEIQFLDGELVADVYQVLNQTDPKIGTELYRIFSEKKKCINQPASFHTNFFL